MGRRSLFWMMSGMMGRVAFKLKLFRKKLGKKLKVCDAGSLEKFPTDLGFCQAFFQKAYLTKYYP